MDKLVGILSNFGLIMACYYHIKAFSMLSEKCFKEKKEEKEKADCHYFRQKHADRYEHYITIEWIILITSIASIICFSLSHYYQSKWFYFFNKNDLSKHTNIDTNYMSGFNSKERLFWFVF